MEALLQKVTSLCQASSVISSEVDINALIQKILEICKDIFQLDHCAFLLYDEYDETLSIKAHFGYDEQTVKTYKQKIGCGIAGLAAKNKKSLLVQDLEAHADYIPGLLDAMSEMAVPLLKGDRLIGVLDIESSKKNAFSHDDLEYLELFALQAAAAYDKLQLLVRNEKMVKRLKRLNSLSHFLHSISITKLLMRKILAELESMFDIQHCALLLYDEQHKDYRIQSFLGFKSKQELYAYIQLESKLFNEAVHTKAGLTRHYNAADKMATHSSFLFKSEMLIPLRIEDKLTALISVHSTSYTFTDDDFLVFQAFSELAVTALQNSQYKEKLKKQNELLLRHLDDFQKMNKKLKKSSRDLAKANYAMERQVRDLRALYEAGQVITASLDLEETLHAIITTTKDVLALSEVAILLLNEETKELQLKVGFTQDKISNSDNNGRNIDIPLKIGERVIGQFALKRINSAAFSADEEKILATLAAQAAIAIENARLFEDTQTAYYESIRSLAEALEARDPYTRGHSERVTFYALRLANAMKLSDESLKIIQYAGLLHDIGKIGISDIILHKVNKLEEQELEMIKQHPEFGDAIISPLKFLNKAQRIVKTHHEYWNGMGYPEGLKGEEIPVEARIISIADAYDAMTSDRPYRKAMLPYQALEELRRAAGSQFEPSIAEFFVRLDLETNQDVK